MNFKLILSALSFLLLFSIKLYAQDSYTYNGKFTFLDGTPIMRGIDTDDFSLDLDRAPDLYAAYVKEVKDGNITFVCSVSGKYTLKFMGFEIVRFEVLNNQEEFTSDLPNQLKLPFNYVAITKPNKPVKIYDDNINLVETVIANEDGYAALKENEQFFSNKFLTTEAQDHFPNPAFFKEIKPSDKGKLSNRTVRLSSNQIKAKRGLVHNIKTNTYYTKREIKFSKDKELLLLFVYDANNQKTTISKLDFSAYPNTSPSEIILDELGRPIINLAKRMGKIKYEYQSLLVGNNGSLQANDEIYVAPAYRFKDNFVKNTRWIIPSYKGIALPAGNHSLRITCNGSMIVTDPAQEAWGKKLGKAEAELQKAVKNKSDGETINQLIKRRDEALVGNPNKKGSIRSGTEISTESFSVFLSPFHDQFWKMDSPFNTPDKNVDSIAYDVKCVKPNPAHKTHMNKVAEVSSRQYSSMEAKREALSALGDTPPSCLQYDSTAFYYYTRYRPSGFDPDAELSKISELADCTLEIDGTAFGYSYKDPYACKGISMNAGNDGYTDEERQKAMESCWERAPVIMGFLGEGSVWGTSIDIFEKNKWDLISTEPLNSWEGPYPELRYAFRETKFADANRKEAAKHCERPSWNNKTKKFHCYEEKAITICFDNYQFTFDEHGRVITNYDALYCGEMEPEENNLKGDEIVVVVTADGYLEETRALAKRSLEASNILLSGYITDKDGLEIEGASIKLRGIDGLAISDNEGIYNLTAKAQGEESHSEVMDIKLKKIGLEISHEELGDLEEDKPYGLVSDGFTTLKLKVKAKGIRPQTVIVKQPELGSFVEQSVLKLPLILNAAGEGEMEYVPPTYLKNEELTKQIYLTDETADKFGLKKQMWVAEVPISISYEDEEGNPGQLQFIILVTRPPVFLIHGFTGNEETWKDLGIYLREQKYESIIREYYKGPADESTIQKQSQKLGQNIQDIRKAYKDNGIYLTRIDITAHSMGGLISRHYISNMAKYGEKAGIVIPYNVKLSKEELAAQRFKTPVNLIDIRKLIMVGTPNHGATWIDGRIGHLGAFMNNVHQVANSQLRSNSQFLANLNSGENKGRHLDPNVQYALLYGRRRLKSFYPPDYIKFKYSNPVGLFAGHITDDDGVVKVSSAKLNGVIDFSFPEKIDNTYGFIHSPAMSSIFAGDRSITTDKEIFEKVNELLLEDIPRMPLKNSFARVYGTEGDVNLRYYSTEAWQAMPVGTSRKLENYWCQFKTGEGRMRIAFFLNNYHWGSIHIEPNTILRIENASPELVEVYLQQGKARFTSRKQEGGGFEIAMGDETEKWYNFNPKAVVLDINTDFIIDKDESVKVHSIKGGVSVAISDKIIENIQGKMIERNGGVELNPSNEMIDSPLPDSGWWSQIDTTYLPDEIIQEKEELPLNENIQQNLIVNGSFEDGPSFSFYLTLRKGATIPGWKVTEETVDLTGSYFKASDGERSIDLVGTPGLGAIEQIFQTTAGKKYQLTFDMAGNPAGGPTIKIMMVSVAGQSAEFEFDITGKTIQEMGWEEKSWVFTAIDSQTNLTFRAMAGATSSNYGAAIDNVKIIQVDGQVPALQNDSLETIVPLQNLGDVEVLAKDKYLPISGFTHLEVNAKNDLGSALESPYEVHISLKNAERLPFIDITNANGFIDNTGNYKYDITISEPNPEDFTSISKIPMEATFIVQIIHPQTLEVEFEKQLTLPLGMALIQGQTLGPDYKPRQQPLPPEFKATNYQIANEVDKNGNFYILFNTTLYDKDIVKFKQLAERTQQLFSMDQFDFNLQWSDACSLPLKYSLPDSIKNQLLPAKKISIGRNGKIDLLTADEHEQRIKRLISKFVEQMPLLPEKKMYVFSKLERMVFRYGYSSDEVPTFVDNLNETDIIDIPNSRKEYWSNVNVRNEEETSFGLIMHVLGHFLQQTITLSESTYYNFLAQQCSGSDKLWTQQVDFKEAVFNKSEYVSFSEAGADFFMYLMFKYIEQNDHDFKVNSIYFIPGYLNQFENIDNVADVKRRFPSYSVSGAQTAFLIEYYGVVSDYNPVNVLADFLYTQMLYAKYTSGVNTAATINDWISAKEIAFRDESIILTDNPQAIANKYGLVKTSQKMKLVPVSEFANSSIEFNGKIYSDISQIPAIFIHPKSSFKLHNGRFKLINPYEGEIQIIEIDVQSQLKIGEDSSIELIGGQFNFKAPIYFKTSLASFYPNSPNFDIKLEPELTTITVYEGELRLKSESDEEIVSFGKKTTMNKKGKIKKPKELKSEHIKVQSKGIEIPFILNNK